MTALEGGAGSLACSSGMMALQIALMAALLDRRKVDRGGRRPVRRDD